MGNTESHQEGKT